MKYKILIALFLLCATACSADLFKQFQEDADLIRLEHLEYWTGLVEEYHQKTGHYPFQQDVETDKDIVLVRIATRQQMSYLASGGANYDKRLDNNASGFFKERPVKQFVAELETVLGRPLDEKYDIQKVPTSSPVGYFYFASKDGYLLWVTCTTCDVTQVSTLLMDGSTATVNIGSEGMVPGVPKALTRDVMLNHPTYKSWVSRPFHKEEYVQGLVKEHHRDSK